MEEFDYSKIVCPKCGKKYFRKKPDIPWISDLVFRIPYEPIYKDGMLQNPEPVEPTRLYFECLECHCNFSVKVLNNQIIDIIDDDKERCGRKKKLENERLDELNKKTEEYALRMNQDGLYNIANTPVISVAPELDKVTTTEEPFMFSDLTAKIDSIVDRLDRLEEYVYNTEVNSND